MWEKDTMFYTLIVSNNGTHKKDAIMIILSLVSYQEYRLGKYVVCVCCELQ